MPIIAGPFGTLLIALVAVVALLLWLSRDKTYPGPRLQSDDSDDIDHEELEQAEREVQDLGSGQRPDEDYLGDDWGPGTNRPRPPERL